MTNSEKYLKDGVDIKQLATEMVDYFNFPPYEGIGEGSIEEFFDKEAKPTLTADERVILRYVDNRYTHIQRDCGLWLLNYEDEYNAEMLSFEMYSHLFQFIKNGEEYSIEELLKDEQSVQVLQR